MFDLREEGRLFCLCWEELLRNIYFTEPIYFLREFPWTFMVWGYYSVDLINKKRILDVPGAFCIANSIVKPKNYDFCVDPNFVRGEFDFFRDYQDSLEGLLNAGLIRRVYVDDVLLEGMCDCCGSYDRKMTEEDHRNALEFAIEMFGEAKWKSEIFPNLGEDSEE